MGINRYVATGNLTRDPSISSTAGGTPVMSFGMAINDRKRNAQTGEWEDAAVFVDCVMYGNRAESLSKILKKGMKCSIEGRLRYSSWEKNGERRSKLEVVINEIEFLSAPSAAKENLSAQRATPMQNSGANRSGANRAYDANNEPYDEVYGYDVEF